mmetsp:Transcript_31153/g.97944  ORF Transcript_31153/g.97944 Transcript_31153/m.97944 type:complete len:350 (-) Transcript_31153:65-1114(-)
MAAGSCAPRLALVSTHALCAPRPRPTGRPVSARCAATASSSSRLLHPQSRGRASTAALPPRSGAWFRHASTLRTCESPYVLTNGRHPPCSSSPPLPTGDSVAALRGPGAFGASSPSSKLHSPPPESSSVSAHTSARGTSPSPPASAPQQTTMPRPHGSGAAHAPARGLGRSPAPAASGRHSHERVSRAKASLTICPSLAAPPNTTSVCPSAAAATCSPRLLGGVPLVGCSLSVSLAASHTRTESRQRKVCRMTVPPTLHTTCREAGPPGIGAASRRHVCFVRERDHTSSRITPPVPGVCGSQPPKTSISSPTTHEAVASRGPGRLSQTRPPFSVTSMGSWSCCQPEPPS